MPQKFLSPSSSFLERQSQPTDPVDGTESELGHAGKPERKEKEKRGNSSEEEEGRKEEERDRETGLPLHGCARGEEEEGARVSSPNTRSEPGRS